MVLSMHGSSTEHEVHEWGVVNALDLLASPSSRGHSSGTVYSGGQMANSASCRSHLCASLFRGLVESGSSSLASTSTITALPCVMGARTIGVSSEGAIHIKDYS